MSVRQIPILFVATCLFFAMSSTLLAQETDPKPQFYSVDSSELGKTKNVHRVGELYLAGQFTEADIEVLKSAGITRVISLRTEGEIDWDQQSALKKAGIEMIEVPFREPDSLSDEIFDSIRELLGTEHDDTLLHCGSANRVGGVWLPHRVLDDGVDVETALEEARKIGLRNEGYEKKALDYIERKLKEKDQGSASRKNINSRFLDPDLDVDAFVQRFEIDNREVYAARKEIIRAMNLKQGQHVADVGAGTGFYSRLFADTVSDSGWVYAIDISPKFIEHITNTAVDKDVFNLTSVLCRSDSVDLPPRSIDVAYVCDTYHHFEHPESTTESIYAALKPGGELFIVDFERIPGKSREWILGHVRAGKETVRKEIESVGFSFVEEVEIPGFDENYFIRFRK